MVSRDTANKVSSSPGNRAKSASRVKSRENLHVPPALVEPSRVASDDDDDPDRMGGPTMMDGAYFSGGTRTFRKEY
jgi:hypothetical protein